MLKQQSPSTESPFAFPFDLGVAQVHLRQDMRDDWFPDVLMYEDVLGDKASVHGVLEELLTQGNGAYPASERLLRDIPKVGFGLRYSLETDFYDRLVYQGICSFLIPYFDPLLSHRVLSHRYDPHPRKAKYLFKNRIDLWKTYEGLTHVCLSDGGVLVVTDLANYFENISTDLITASLLRLLPSVAAGGSDKLRIRNAITTLGQALERWCYRKQHGLPQNRDASSFLANVVLTEVDRTMERAGFDYYRYVDDIRICCADERDARNALNALIEQLRTVGMNINGAKTALLTSSSANVGEFFPGRDDDRISAIDNMWRSRSRRVISRSVPVLEAMLSEVLQNKASQSRQFRFLVNRIRKLVDADIFGGRSLLSDEFFDLLVDALDTQAASTDQFCSLFRSAPDGHAVFERIERRLLSDAPPVYVWQASHLWLLLAEVGHRSEQLIEEAYRQAMANIYSAHVGALFIYMGRFEAHEKLVSFIDLFPQDLGYQSKRCFLIACKAIDPAVLKSLVGMLDIRVRGTIARLMSNPKTRDRFIIRPEAAVDDDLYDEISPYL